MNKYSKATIYPMDFEKINIMAIVTFLIVMKHQDQKRVMNKNIYFELSSRGGNLQWQGSYSSGLLDPDVVKFVFYYTES